MLRNRCRKEDGDSRRVLLFVCKVGEDIFHIRIYDLDSDYRVVTSFPTGLAIEIHVAAQSRSVRGLQRGCQYSQYHF